jgi:hypothetical protein
MERAGEAVELARGTLLHEFFPDFVLAVAFFTALCFAALSDRFSKRSAAVASLAVGVALSTGLVWWEAQHGYSIRSLGPIAVGFALLLLAAVMYRAINAIGGTIAGLSFTFGVSILIGWVLGIPWPINEQILQTVTTVALLVGILALVNHRQDNHRWCPQHPAAVPSVRNDPVRLYRDRHLAGTLANQLRRARREADLLDDRPELENDLMLQLRRILPAEGYLTERLAALRERAYHMREGQVARIEEIRDVLSKLPAEGKRKLGEELSTRFKELKLDLRLERLDRACAEAERRIHHVTAEAAEALKRHEYRKVTGLLEAAQRLQAHNARLFKIIDRTEKKLLAIAQHVTQQTPEVNQP